MNKTLLIFLVYMVATVLFGYETYEEKREDLLKVITEELDETIRLSAKRGHKDPVILLRLADLSLEKGIIIRENENDYFLSLPPSKRSKVKKSKYFKKSKASYASAKKTCVLLLKKYKNFRSKNHAYYIMAYIDNEANKIKKAQRYFELALRYSRKGSLIATKSELALANIYYNQKKYHKALPLFISALKDKSDRWWTKNAYNMSWTYYRMGKHNKSLNIMKEVLRHSKSSKYIDMSKDVIRSITKVFVDANRLDEGNRFFRSEGVDFSKQVSYLAKVAMDRGHYSKAEKYLRSVKKISKDLDGLIEIDLTLLRLYDNKAEYRSHLVICKELFKIHKKGGLDNDAYGIFEFNVKRVAALLQKSIIKQKNKKRRKIKVVLASEYFRILSLLTKDKKYSIEFLRGETFYAGKMFGKAIESYDLTYINALKAKDKKFVKLALEGMLAILGKRNVNKKTVHKYQERVYRRYIQFDPKSGKSKKILQKLFSTYISQNNLKESENVLVSFKSRFPKEHTKQEKMLAKIMDHYYKKNNRKRLGYWLARIDRKDFVLSKKYVNKIKQLKLRLKFKDVDRHISKGNKKDALSEYLMIYKNPSSGREERKVAAYNISLLFHEFGLVEKTKEWIDKTLLHTKLNDVQIFEQFAIFTEDFFNRRHFLKSANTSSKLLKILCKSNKKNLKDTLFKNATLVYLAESYIKRFKSTLNVGKQCRINSHYILDAKYGLMEWYGDRKKWLKYDKSLVNLKRFPVLYGSLIEKFFVLYKVYEKRGSTRKKNIVRKTIDRIYKQAKKRSIQINLASLDIVAHFKIFKLESYVAKAKKLKLRFPEKRFNKNIKRRLAYIDSAAKVTEEIRMIGSGKGLVRSYYLLVKSYQDFVKEVRAVTPPGKSQQYIKSFKHNVFNITIPIARKGEQMYRDMNEIIKKKNIFSYDNYWFLLDKKLPFKIEYRYIYSGVIMDRAGV